MVFARFVLKIAIKSV